MRLTYILAVTVVATLHASATAFSSVRESKAAIENGGVPVIVDSTFAEGGRLLCRVDNDEDDLDDLDDLDDDDGDDDDDDDDDRDAFGEERGFTDTIKKFNPVTAAKKSAQKTAERAAKIKGTLKEVVDYQEMIKRAREIIKD